MLTHSTDHLQQNCGPFGLYRCFDKATWPEPNRFEEGVVRVPKAAKLLRCETREAVSLAELDTAK